MSERAVFKAFAGFETEFRLAIFFYILSNSSLRDVSYLLSFYYMKLLNSKYLVCALSLSACAFSVNAQNAQSVTTDVVGYTSTTLAGGAGNIFAPAFINSNSLAGVFLGVTSSANSVFTVSGLSGGEFDRSTSVAGVSKGYPLYYVEILNDTDVSDSIDTVGLIVDIVSNTGTSIVVAADADAQGLNGDEQFVIRKHVTLSSLFAGSTGLAAFTDLITIYNEDGPGTAVSHLPDGSGGFVLGADFATISSDAPIYPGTGFVINNVGAVTIVPTGTVKESDTQVAIYGGSVVNIISSIKPLPSVDMSADGRLNEALSDFTDIASSYSNDGSLIPVTPDGALGPGVLDDGAGGFVSAADFVTPVSVVIDGTSDAMVVNAGNDSVYKVKGVVISN